MAWHLRAVGDSWVVGVYCLVGNVPDNNVRSTVIAVGKGERNAEYNTATIR
jgi:hypothetical protein